VKNGRVHIMIRGRVQGVFFRAGTRDMAQGLGLKGWVRNTSDGAVEAVFEGPEDDLRKAVAWCRKGPPGAHVTGIDKKWYNFIGEFDGFDIRFGY
jgi:acylphosphatase